jgi:hypothetical protein
MATWNTGDPLGRCNVCGATRRLHSNLTVERHTRKLKGRPGRLRCRGTGKKAAA